MEGFRVTLVLGAPLAIGKLPYGPTLDSVLLGEMSGGQYLSGDAERQLIKRFGSMVLVEYNVPATSVLLPDDASLSYGADIHPRKSSKTEMDWWRKGGGYRCDSGEFLGKMHSIRMVFARRWEWYGIGDIELVTEVLSSIVAVGARRGSGYGMVASLSVVRTPDPVWLVNGVDQLQLSRPIPVDRLDKLLGAQTLTRDDLTGAHAIVPLPRWPTPSWGADFEPEPTMLPVIW